MITTKNTRQKLVLLIAMLIKAVQCRVHRPMKHILGFNRSHWMPPLGECLHHMLPLRLPWSMILVKNMKPPKIYF
jgi:hypothetical protein